MADYCDKFVTNVGLERFTALGLNRDLKWARSACSFSGMDDDGGMTRQEDLWGVALAVMRMRGDRAPLFVAERIGALAVQGDLEGVAAWREVASNISIMQVPGRSC